jgi:hypothetical protein
LLENAEFAREVAEIGVPKYDTGIVSQDLAVAEGEVTLARNALDSERSALQLDLLKPRIHRKATETVGPDEMNR